MLVMALVVVGCEAAQASTRLGPGAIQVRAAHRLQVRAASTTAPPPRTERGPHRDTTRNTLARSPSTLARTAAGPSATRPLASRPCSLQDAQTTRSPPSGPTRPRAPDEPRRSTVGLADDAAATTHRAGAMRTFSAACTHLGLERGATRYGLTSSVCRSPPTSDRHMRRLSSDHSACQLSQRALWPKLS